MRTTDAGAALLASVIGTNGDVIDDVTISGDDFPEPKHGVIWDAAVKLHEAGRKVDFVTLSEAVPEQYRGEVIGLMALTDLTYNAVEWARVIEHHGTRRRLGEAAAQIAALDPQLSSADLVDRSQAILSAAVDRSVKPQYRFVGDMIDDVLTRVVESTTFIESPWMFLNRAIGGFRPGAVYVVAARPGVGKTVIAAQIATALADHGSVAFSSLEMSALELVQRFISERAMVNVRALKNNDLSERDFQSILNRREILEKLNIAIDDRTNISPADVRAFVRGLSKKHPVSGVVVDYLQLMSSTSSFERYQQVTEFSRQMKILAKDFGVPVILLSQLNRESEKRSDGIPKIADLRESGAIEQDADVVMLLRREGDEPNERMIIDVAKNRHGMTGEVELDWQGMYSRAVDI